MTDLIPSGSSNRSAGCGGWLLITIIVAVIMAAFVGAIWWALRDLHEI